MAKSKPKPVLEPKVTVDPRGSSAQPHTSTLSDLISSCEGDVESLKDEIIEWHDNLPENLQEAQKGQDLQECAESLETCLESLQTAESSMSGPGGTALGGTVVRYTQDTRRSARSRSDRLCNVTTAIEACAEVIDKLIEAHPTHKDDLEEIRGYLQDYIDEAQNVSFPGMY